MTTRRNFLKTTGLVGALLYMPSVVKAEDNSKPNCIYILADDLGYGDLGCYGQKLVKTPHLDRMCSEGIKFTDHYSGSTVCAPSRFTFMTGQHIARAPTIGQGQQLVDSDHTIAKMLKKTGYRTACIGKWGLGKMTGHPNKQGFDYYFGFLSQMRAHFYYSEYVWRNTEKVVLKNNTVKQDKYIHDLFTEEALEFIEKNRSKPFFLYLPYTIPHAELVVPEDSMKPYLGKLEDEDKGPIREPYKTIDQGKKGYNSARYPHEAFAGMVSRLDRDVGRILTLLKKLNIHKNTIVFFSSDNGPHHEGGADPDFFNSRGPLKGIKRDLYEGGIRVPFIAWWPGKIKPGSVTNHISAFWDMLPTIAELAGAGVEKTDGISMVPVLLGNKSAQKKHEYLFWDYSAKTAVRKGKWKAVRIRSKENPDAAIELYDLEKDISEKNNVASQHPDIVARMAEIMKMSRAKFSKKKKKKKKK